MTIQSLAELKRCLADGMALELVKAEEISNNGDWQDWAGHKWLGHVRKAEKIQTNGVRFEGGSWMYFDKSGNWTFRDGIVICTDKFGNSGVRLTYKIKQ